MRLLLAVVLSIALLDARAGDVADACVADLDALPGFLLANDAGGMLSAAQTLRYTLARLQNGH